MNKSDSEMEKQPGEELTAENIETCFDRLWPICRSITGDGLRESFRILQELIPLELHEVESGSKIFDWEVPEEWNIRDAYILAPGGEKIADFKQNNLHVVNYSVPVDKELSFEELQPHLHVKEELPDAVPYVTSYYKKTWGFCLDYHTYRKLPRKDRYRVYIDSTLEKGSLTYGDCLLKGESDDEILFSSYLCHPSMANNELSGPLTLSFLYRQISRIPDRRYSYRFVIAPETIGTLCFLHQNRDDLIANLKAGYVFTCCGDSGPVTYKRTREESSLTDRVTSHILKHNENDFNTLPYEPIGSDERQYGSPGFNLPVGVLMRTPFSEYPEYHTSLDNKELMDFQKMERLVRLVTKMVHAYELNRSYENQIRFGEPFLGKRDLYEDLSTKRSHSETIHLRMRLLNYLDGTRDLLEICDRYDYNILDIRDEIRKLTEHGLIQ